MRCGERPGRGFIQLRPRSTNAFPLYTVRTSLVFAPRILGVRRESTKTRVRNVEFSNSYFPPPHTPALNSHDTRRPPPANPHLQPSHAPRDRSHSLPRHVPLCVIARSEPIFKRNIRVVSPSTAPTGVVRLSSLMEKTLKVVEQGEGKEKRGMAKEMQILNFSRGEKIIDSAFVDFYSPPRGNLPRAPVHVLFHLFHHGRPTPVPSLPLPPPLSISKHTSLPISSPLSNFPYLHSFRNPIPCPVHTQRDPCPFSGPGKKESFRAFSGTVYVE